MSIYTANILWNKEGSDAEVDLSEIGQNGVRTGTVTYVVAKFNKGAYSNSTANYISFAGNDFNPNKFMFEWWFLTDGWSETNGVPTPGVTHAWGAWHISDNDRVLMYDSGTGLYIHTIIGGVSRMYQHTAGLTWGAGALHHILFCYDKDGIDGGADTTRIYLDGDLKDTNAGAAGNQANPGVAGTLHDMVYFFGGTPRQPFIGTHDNIKIYDDATTSLAADVHTNDDNEGFDPAVPGNLDATDGDYTTHIAITWDEAFLADDYRLSRSDTAGGVYTVVQDWSVDLSYDDGAVETREIYWYKVEARNAGFESGLSGAEDGFKQAKIISAVYVVRNPQVLITSALIDIYALGHVKDLIKIKESKTFRRDKLIVNSINMNVRNYNDFYSINNPRSVFSNSRWRYDIFRKINKDGEIEWDGILKDIKRNGKSKTATIKSDDQLSKFLKNKIEYESDDWETPATSFKNICDREGLTSYDTQTLQKSIDKMDSESCYIWCHFSKDDDITFQQAIEKLGEIGCADVYNHKNKLYYKHYEAFTGAVKIQLTESNLKSPLTIESPEKNLINNYRIGYVDDGGIPIIDSTQDNLAEASRDRYGNHELRELNCSANQQIEMKDIITAKYIGNCYLQRSHINLSTQPRSPEAITFDLYYSQRDWLDLETFFSVDWSDENWNNKIFESFGIEYDEDKNNVNMLALEVNV